MADFVEKPGPRKWPGVHFDRPANKALWRQALGQLLVVDETLLDDWTVEEFMRDMENTRVTVLQLALAAKDLAKRPGRRGRRHFAGEVKNGSV